MPFPPQMPASLVLAIVIATAFFHASQVEAGSTPEQKCQNGRYKATAKYNACQQKAFGKFFATSTNPGANAKHAATLAKCQKKHLKVWAKLQARAAGTGSTCDAPRFLNDGTTVVDNLTGLQWERKTDDDTVHDTDNVYSWSTTPYVADGTAFTDFLTTLNSGGCFEGHCDWRLPTIYELQTILQEPFQCFTSPCIDESVFGPTANTNAYWSATTDAHQLVPAAAWYVFFHDGLVNVNLKTNEIYVRAVRGGL